MKPEHTTLRDKIQGPVFSILTPFDPKSEEIDFETLEAYLQKIYDAGGRHFYVMAYNSRYSQLTPDEIKELNRFVATRVKQLDESNVVIVADPIHCSTKVSIEYAQHAEEIGADIISLIVRERFYSEEQIHRHFQMVSDQVGIGILVHEMPFLNGMGGPSVNYPISLLDRLADVPNVVAIKEDAKDDEFSAAVVKKIKDRVAIVISGGGKRQWMRFADQGCQAWLNGIGVFEPRLATLFWQAWQAGRKEVCDRIVNEIEVPFFAEGVSQLSWHLTIKSALESRGVMSRHDRMPLMPLSDEQHHYIETLMAALPVDEIIARYQDEAWAQISSRIEKVVA